MGADAQMAETTCQPSATVALAHASKSKGTKEKKKRQQARRKPFLIVVIYSQQLRRNRLLALQPKSQVPDTREQNTRGSESFSGVAVVQFHAPNSPALHSNSTGCRPRWEGK